MTDEERRNLEFSGSFKTNFTAKHLAVIAAISFGSGGSVFSLFSGSITNPAEHATTTERLAACEKYTDVITRSEQLMAQTVTDWERWAEENKEQIGKIRPGEFSTLPGGFPGVGGNK